MHRLTQLLLAGGLMFAGPVSAQNLLGTTYELKDGPVLDLAAPANATVNPARERLWIAQGRVRAALNLQSGGRSDAEDRYFDGVQPRPLPAVPGASSGWERVRHVELDEVNAKLYTLTDQSLYREDVSIPSAPVFERVVGLASIPGMAGEVSCVRIWSPTQTIVLLTTKKLMTLSGMGPGPILIGTTVEVAPATPLQDTLPAPTSINYSQVNEFARMTLAQDVDNRVLAYVIGETGGYGVARNGPGVLVVCDLNAAGAFANPTFDKDPSAGVAYVFFDPMRTSLVYPPTVPSEWGASDVAVVRDTSGGTPKQIVALACGVQAQLWQLDMTSAWTLPYIELGSLSVDPLRAIQRVNAHPLDTSKWLAVAHRGNAWLVARNGGTNFSSAPEIFQPTLSDVPIVVRPGPKTTLWAAPIGNVDFQIKAIDMTQPVAPATSLALALERFWPHGSDGGVAIPEWNSIYLMTFGSVVRYERSGNIWLPDLSSAMPAAQAPAEGGNPNQPGITEHIALVRDVTYPGDHRLLVAEGTGGFYEFKLDPLTYNPLTPRHVARPPLSTISSSWSDTEASFANDIAFVRVGGIPWVLTDLALLRSPQSQAALLAYRLDVPTSAAVPIRLVFDTQTSGNVNANTDVIHVTNDVTPIAFVNYPHGFVSIRLEKLGTPSPTLLLGSNINLPASGFAYRRCGSIAARRNRVFVAMAYPTNASPVVHAQINVYAYSASTGVVGALIQQLTDRDVHCQSNGAIAAANVTNPPIACTTTGTPAATFGRTARMRYHATSATCGALYVCAEPFLLELAYDTTSDKLKYSGHWVGDYTGHLQDCHRYDFGQGPQLLTVKDSESFALVTPTTLSCP